MKHMFDDLLEEVRFPIYKVKDTRSLKSSLRSITMSLRDACYEASPQRHEVYTTPFGGPIGDSIGPWPEFILRGLPCQKSKQGCCTPCFYSRMPQVNCSIDTIYDSIVEQVSYILRNFDALVVRNQWGPVAWQDPKCTARHLAFVLTPTGSFFDEMEFPLPVRNRILSMIVDHSTKTDHLIALHVETHAEHLLAATEAKEEFDETISLLKRLNGRILLGFESSNPFVRNVLYNKYLEERVFLNAVEVVRSNGLGVGAFAFAGINPLNDAEILGDAATTLNFLHERGIAPVVMFHNVHAYTIQELLFLYRAHKLPEPRTVLEIIKHLISTIPDKRQAHIDPWLIADPVGGPPPPRYNIFTETNHITCPKCTEEIYRAVVQLRQTRHIDSFLESHKRLSSCHCAVSYDSLLREQLKQNMNLSSRTSLMVKTASNKLTDYISTVRPIINEVEGFSLFQDNVPRYGEFNDPAINGPQLKAELLCYGIRISPELKEDILQFNSYIHEAGFVHAAHFLIGTHLVNTCVAESFCEQSPFVLRRRNGHFELSKEGIVIAPCEVLPTPTWCNEVVEDFTLESIVLLYEGTY